MRKYAQKKEVIFRSFLCYVNFCIVAEFQLHFFVEMIGENFPSGDDFLCRREVDSYQKPSAFFGSCSSGGRVEVGVKGTPINSRSPDSSYFIGFFHFSWHFSLFSPFSLFSFFWIQLSFVLLMEE